MGEDDVGSRTPTCANVRSSVRHWRASVEMMARPPAQKVLDNLDILIRTLLIEPHSILCFSDRFDYRSSEKSV